MRGILGVVALLGIGGGALTAPAMAQQPTNQQFAYINSARILNEAPGRAEAEAQFEREVGVFRQQIQTMEDSLRGMVQAFDQEQAGMSQEARLQRATVLQTREAEYQQRADSLNQTMQRRQAELVRPIMEQINRVLDAIRAENNYMFIFDVAADGQPIVAADTTLDITSAVIARLRAAGPPQSSSRPGVQQQPAGVTRPRQ